MAEPRMASPTKDARYRHVIKTPGVGAKGKMRTVRVACYNPRANEAMCVVSLGIGPENSEALSEAAVKITEELWKEIKASVDEAFRAAD